ncbi:MAG: hypothetical protein N3D80_01870 [Ignavibacterium album]|uniref:hypothetical protein n=1 Tax=Ignavibacterium album TaxID=591197 RepID=UPI0026EAA302|nr:hypothetical protein [Ignavibacterium album]MCX8104603.1 hypothetical protein [Ignavibacterium album]
MEKNLNKSDHNNSFSRQKNWIISEWPLIATLSGVSVYWRSKSENIQSYFILLHYILIILIYYLLKKVFSKKSHYIKTYLSIFISLILSTFITFYTIRLIGVNKPIKYEDKKVINSNLFEIDKYLSEFAIKEKLLISKFKMEPKSVLDYQNNIKVLKEIIPAYREKDSILIKKIHNISIHIAYKKYEYINLYYELNDLMKNIDSISVSANKYLTNLLLYFHSKINNDKNSNIYLKNYINSYSEFTKFNKNNSYYINRISDDEIKSRINKIFQEYNRELTLK